MFFYSLTAAVFSLSVVQSASSSSHTLECSSTCGKPSSLDFCSHVSFPVCGFESSFQDLDVLAMTRYNQWANTSHSLLTKLPQYANKNQDELDLIVHKLDLHNTSSSCGSFLRNLECAIHFPACEIGRDYTRLCEKSCKDHVKKECPGLEGICITYAPHEIESKGKCFKLEYKGPAVGMWVAGFTISLVFSILNSVGINLQKLSMTRNEAAEVKKGTCSQPLWMLGFSLVALGSLLDFVAFGMAPQTLLAPLAALSLVWNMFIAPIFHKEKVTKENIMATVIIFFGVTLTVIFAGHSTPTYELGDLIRLYKQPVMYAYMFMIATFLAAMFYFSRYIERTHRFEGGLYHIACYGGIAGTFGGQSVLLAKSTVELLKSAIWGESGAYMFTQLASYMIVFGLFGCLYFQVHFLNGGLARFDALVMIPVYQSFWILTSVLGGIMYFEEYVNMTPSSMFVFTIGGVITIAGIIFLLQTRQTGEGNEATGRYVELDIESNGSSSDQAVTPSSAWNADDSDEEEIQLKTHNKLMLDDDDNVHRPVINSQSSDKNKKGGNANDVANAIYRSPSSSNNRSKDDDDFI